jgi:hypothetical protein
MNKTRLILMLVLPGFVFCSFNHDRTLEDRMLGSWAMTEFLQNPIFLKVDKFNTAMYCFKFMENGRYIGNRTKRRMICPVGELKKKYKGQWSLSKDSILIIDGKGQWKDTLKLVTLNDTIIKFRRMDIRIK